jgi:hypothetical protein
MCIGPPLAPARGARDDAGGGGLHGTAGDIPGRDESGPGDSWAGGAILCASGARSPAETKTPRPGGIPAGTCYIAHVVGVVAQQIASGAAGLEWGEQLREAMPQVAGP